MAAMPINDAPQSNASAAFWCCFYGAGVIASLVVYGVLQERIMSIEYDGELFAYSVFLVFCNRIAAVIFAIGMAMYRGEELVPKAPIWKYLIISFSNVYASTCQYEALKYVSFAVQMLCKSFKMMPVMIWGMIIVGKSYGIRDWTVALAVTLGSTEFMMTGPTTSSSTASNSMYGFAFLFAFLVLDGLTSTMQEKLFKEHKVSKYNQMSYVNGLSSITSLATLVFAGQLFPAISFGTQHPAFWTDTAILSASAVSGQFFIYSQVKEFGALVFAATMNVRQVISIIVSYIRYHNPITGLQIVGLSIIFGALFYKSIMSMFEAPSKAEKLPLLSEKKDALEASMEDEKVKDSKV